MTNFKICPSLFSPKEQIVPTVHIVHCIDSERCRNVRERMDKVS